MSRSFVVFASFVLACGCGPIREIPSTVLAPDEDEHVACVVIDLSGSFEHMMAEDGKAYDFVLQVIDRFFRDRIGTRDKLIIAQVSASDRLLLWHGTPQELRQQFPSPIAFRPFLFQKTTP